MSLRVLLADESASIRKVFQMGLQDYGAEVKSVPSGLDVIEVAQSFQPHIIFADILLQKKNGYEVCEAVRKHPQLSQIPVILMWSSFMELDQKKYQASGAQGELEKPFDVEHMRKIIQSQVQYTQSQQISHFLNFPASIKQEFVEDEKSQESADQVATTQPAATPTPQGNSAPSANTSAPPPQQSAPASPTINTSEAVETEADSSLDLDLDFDFEMETPEEEASPSLAESATPALAKDASDSGVAQTGTPSQIPQGVHESLDEDIMGRVATDATPHPEDDEGLESNSVFNRQMNLDEDDEDKASAEPSEPFFEEPESWAVKPLHSAKVPQSQPTPPSPPQEESDEFQSMDLHKPKGPSMNLDDFLYKPEGMGEPPPPPEPTSDVQTSSNPIRQVQIAGSIDTQTNMNPISPEEAEHILRQEARQIIQSQLSQELQPTLERIIREELNKILHEEMERERSQSHAPSRHE